MSRFRREHGGRRRFPLSLPWEKCGSHPGVSLRRLWFSTGDEFLGGGDQEGGFLRGVRIGHGLGLTEKTGGGIFGFRIAGAGHRKLHHQPGVLLVEEDGFLQQQPCGAVVSIRHEFVGKFDKFIGSASADFQKLGGMVARLFRHSMLAVVFRERFVGERFARVNFQDFVESSDALLIAARGEIQDTESYFKIERCRHRFDMPRENTDGDFRAPAVAEMVAGGARDVRPVGMLLHRVFKSGVDAGSSRLITAVVETLGTSHVVV